MPDISTLELQKEQTEGVRGARVFRGRGVGDGLAVGRLFFYTAHRPAEEKFKGEEEERQAFRRAVTAARREFSRLRQTSEEAGEIFTIHEMLLSDPEFTEGVENLIRAGVPAAGAAEKTGNRMGDVMAHMDDEYFSARAADMRDVGERVARIIRGGSSLADLMRESADEREGEDAAAPEPFLIVFDELNPGDTALLDPHRIGAVVCFSGSVNSHASIIARSMDLPVVVRTGEIPSELDGELAIVRAAEGSVTVAPDGEELRAAREQIRSRAERKEKLLAMRNRAAVTPDGKKIRVFANVGKDTEAAAAFGAGADGIGLFRSEFLFLGRSAPPDEEEQYAAYRRVLEAAGGREVIIRTLDIGADKTVPYLSGGRDGGEDNPALGVRGIRLCFAHPEIFRTQLRALCRAAAHGRLRVMLPMIVSAEEVRRAREMLEEAAQQVGAAEKIPLGIMLETPAAAIMADRLADCADFFSVGTNDLCQYTFAADRQNGALSDLTEGEERLEPVFRLIRNAADCIHAAGGEKWIGVCGELAADTRLTSRFISCGVDELSVTPPAIAAIKAEIIG